MKARNPSTGNLETVYVKALDSLPVGVILSFPTTSSAELPNGYMFCDGSAISRTTYSELFSLIGTSYGAGDGSTTFNLPNLKGKVQVGIDSNDTDFDTIGETGGSKFLQEHNHNFTIRNTTGINTSAPLQDDLYLPVGTGWQNSSTWQTANAGTGNSGNLQPYIVTNFIIKVSETRAIAAKVVNASSNSTKDTYSCDYQNKAFGGTVLYEDATGIATGTIPLSDSIQNYSYIEVYGTATSDQANCYAKVSKERYDKRGNLFEFNADGNLYVQLMVFEFSNNTTINIRKNISWWKPSQSGSGAYNGSSNEIKIYKVVGYK